MPITVSGDPVSTLTGVPGAFYLSLTPVLGQMTYAPRHTAVRGLKGRDVGVWFFRAGNRTVLFSSHLFLKNKSMFSMRQGTEGAGNMQGNWPSPDL